MSSTSRAWIAAMKNHSFCSCCRALRSLSPSLKQSSGGTKVSPKERNRPRPRDDKSVPPAVVGTVSEAQEPMRKVVYLASWGPY
ncbi:hypothetical protein MLD38_022018 [Melastoma candidum]|uniref:Uncharacterized protein n=1 Tax=Melastoma candidum TaxID=119954 RepID=A0ACB9QR15_9MYRT|nr:hypothetical protein MLD38_022018 [Melastoma candidum]